MANGLGDVIDAHAEYLRQLKKHRNLKKTIAAHLAAALPEGIAIEWSQGGSGTNPSRFEVGSVTVFPEKTQVLKDDGGPTEGLDADDPTTEWVDTEDASERGFYLDDGIGTYQGTIEGLSKADLRTLIKTWKELPLDVLDKAYGDAIVRVLSNGKVAVTEN